MLGGSGDETQQPSLPVPWPSCTEFGDAAEYLERRLAELDHAIAQARQRATGRFEQDGEHTELRQAIERMLRRPGGATPAL